MKNKKDFSYFKAFVGLSEYTLRAAEMLNKTLHNFNKDHIEGKVIEMHEIEHSADIAKHEIINRLAKEFLPPIEREDIVSLAEKIDDVTDYVEDVLINISIFNIQSIPQEIIDFSEVIMKCCKSMTAALSEFEHFKKSKTLHTEIVEINRLEEIADSNFVNGVKNLFRTTNNAIDIIVWKEMFESLEKCCDACESVANTIENIVMKNS